MTVSAMQHPRDVLLEAQGAADALPVCDHYCGVEARMRKSLALQAELSEEFGACVFDVTLDCEDGAPVGGEREHATMVAALAVQAAQAGPHRPRVAVRVHSVDHSAFEQEIETIVGTAASALCHLMLPKVESVQALARAAQCIDQVVARTGRSTPLPLHALIESPLAVRHAFDIAAHPRVQSLSFGLMDFVSAHGGAIPAAAMGIGQDGAAAGADQFSHPLVLRAKLEIASACHAFGKVPSHCVVTEFADVALLQRAARQAARSLGYTRMWSIHPAQIRPILAAFAPDPAEVELAATVLLAAGRAHWAPIAVQGVLQDRASYRYFWQVLQRARQTGRAVPPEVQAWLRQPDAAEGGRP
jgi:citrate lyase subunit beta / citryl-CoA lyase